MYLLSASEANAVISPNSGAGTTTRSVTIDTYSEALASVTSRVEESLEIGSLSRATVVDYFSFTNPRFSDYQLSLSSQFVSEALVDRPVMADANGLPVSYLSSLQYPQGLADVRAPRGTFGMTYVAGFAVDDDGVFIGVPEWLKSIAKIALGFEWRLRRAQAPDNVSFGDLMNAQRREIYTRVTKRMQRPRMGVEYPSRTVRNDG